MQLCRAVVGAQRARSVLLLLERTILLFCIGWTLSSTGRVLGAPVIDPEEKDSDSNNHNKIGKDAADAVGIPKGHEIALTDIRIGRNSWGDKNETGIDMRGSPPEILLPESIIRAWNSSRDKNLTGRGDREGMEEPLVVEMEYQPELVLRCEARGNPKPNVSWDYEGGNFPHYVASSSLKHGHSGGDNGSSGVVNKEGQGEEAWVDLKLPKLNNAFYGRIRCLATNLHGNATWEVKLVHNAGSSVMMKIVRCTLASVFLLVAVLVVKGILWVDRLRTDKLYERLPPQDFEIIKKFKKGLEPPPPSPCSSIIVADNKKSLLDGATSCVKITVTGDEADNGNIVMPERGGYRPVKHISSSPDLQKRLVRGGPGTSTPSTCSSGQLLDGVNGWTNYVPYDDKMETSSRHFQIDFTTVIENGSYGAVYAGMVRNDLTMEWTSVAVKCGKVDEQDDDTCLLEYVLTELKILASLPKPHDNIVNLRGAYTKKLHERNAYVFVDFCGKGTLASFIDLNERNFQEVLNDKPKDFITSGGSNDPVAGGSQNNGEKITLRNLFSWAWQIADGMNFLHKHKIMHGNLNAANIYLTSNLTAKVGNIGYPPMASEGDMLESTGEVLNKQWLTAPHFCYEQFSKKSDVWDYGRLVWEIFDVRRKQCPDNGRIVEFMRSHNENDGEPETDDELDVPQYATEEVFEVILSCWNENVTLCPEFDFFVKAFKKIYKEAVLNAGGKDKTSKF